MGIFGRYGILTAADVWTYSVRKVQGHTSPAVDLGTVTVASGAGAKSAYVQIIAVTAARYDGLIITLKGVTGIGVVAHFSYLVDIAIGAAGAEVVQLPNLRATESHQNTNITEPVNIYIPIIIEVGSRIAARAQNDSGIARNIEVSVKGLLI